MLTGLTSLFRRRTPNAAARDAELLIFAFGARAYEEARSRARAARLAPAADGLPVGHWDRVRAEVARITYRKPRLDTATRYLEE